MSEASRIQNVVMKLKVFGSKQLHALRNLGKSRRPDYEVDFLPAAIEVIERPPSPVGRMVAWLLILLFTIALVTAFLADLDVVVVASGRLSPSGNIKVLQPLEPGTVKQILVRDGDFVRSGQALIEIDPTQILADRDRTQQELVQVKLDVARLRALRLGREDAFVLPEGASSTQVALTRNHLASQIEENRAKLEAIQRQIAQRNAELQTNEASLDRLKASQKYLSEKARIHSELFRLNAGALMVKIDAEQSLEEIDREIYVSTRRAVEITANIAALQQSFVQARAEIQSTSLSELVTKEQKLQSLELELIKLNQRLDLFTLKAPVDGHVQQLAVHTLGGVVTTSQQLLVLVPKDAALEIVSTIANKDIGFVFPGQPVEIKIEAYPFTRYGLIPGKVERISSTSVSSDGEKSQVSQSANVDSGSPGATTSYFVHVSLSENEIDTELGTQQLRPGLAAQVEIATGKRTLMEYLLAPLSRYKQESMRER